MAGETVRMDEVVRIAERVFSELGGDGSRGLGGKWEVEKVTAEELEVRVKEFEKTGDETKKLWAQLGLVYTNDREGEGWLEPRLSGLFPDLKPLTVEGYLRKYYA
jgi:hypothetical protein